MIKLSRILLFTVYALAVTAKAAESEVVFPSAAARPGCQPKAAIPATRVNTAKQLTKLREAMSSPKLVKGPPLKAYIIPTDDEHQSEYVSAHDRRREHISGFSGSAGIAVVTTTEAALWTDGRYFLQAELQLDCNWILMKTGDESVPTITEWLHEVLQPGDRIGADPKLVGADTWLEWRNELTESGLVLVPLATNLVDTFWNQSNGRPRVKSDTAYVHSLIYAGKSWQDKVASVRAELNETGMDAMVVTSLDEVAWLLNIRGSDMATSPFVKSYVFLSHTRVILYIAEIKVTADLRKHFNADGCDEALCVEIRRYDTIFEDLPRLTSRLNSVLLPSKYSYNNGASFAIYDSVPQAKRRSAVSPILLLKAAKNPTEVQGMKNAHIRDSVALCDFMSLLEEEVSKGEHWDELKVAAVLSDYRKQQSLNKGVSFQTIVGFGPNGAVIHYNPKPETNRVIDNSSLLLLDSGGQYLDGTTDVTRTFHFGTPTAEQKELYTRVLMGAIDLAMLVIPEYVEDSQIDVVARSHLYSVGLDYRHGTGHGIGAFLGVHESPTQIKVFRKKGHPFEENYFFSDEPGYYKENDFGIRLETILRVVRKEIKGSTTKFFAFEPITLVPFEPKLIVPEMMTIKQIQWLNQYSALVRTRVGEELKRQNRMRGFYWLMSKTGHVSFVCPQQNRAAVLQSSFVVVILTVLRYLYC